MNRALWPPLLLLTACAPRPASPAQVVDGFFSALERNDVPAARAALSGNLERLQPPPGQSLKAWEAANRQVFGLMKHRTLGVEALNMGGTGVNLQVTTIDAVRVLREVAAAPRPEAYNLGAAPTLTATLTLEVVKSQGGQWLIFADDELNRLISGYGWN